jgi:hypothetical protein
METFTQLFGDLLAFVYHCFDRIVIYGYLSGLSRPEQVVHAGCHFGEILPKGDLDDGTVSQLLEELAGEMDRPSDCPRCSLIFGSTSCARWALSRSCVPSSSAPIKREYPATSAARIAVRRRTGGIGGPAVRCG